MEHDHEPFFISKEIEFDAGHRVPNHNSKCKNPHGHRYKVRAVLNGKLVSTPGDPEEGMIKDFGFLKELLTVHVHDVLDHGFIVYERDGDLLALFRGALMDRPEVVGFGWKVIVFPYIPTAENIARWVFEQLQVYIDSQPDFKLSKVVVWETPTSVATYAPGGYK